MITFQLGERRVGLVLALSLAAAASIHCGGDDSEQVKTGPQVSCGPGTVLDGNQCVLADAGPGGTGGDGPEGGTGGGSAGQDPDGGTGGTSEAGPEITCGPGTVLLGNQCVPDADGSAADGGEPSFSILKFTANRLWGDAPLDTDLYWHILAPSGTALQCDLDSDGDGTFETTIASCPLSGSVSVTLTTPGRVEPTLRVTANGVSVEATELIFCNQVEWVPELVRVEALPGITSSSMSDDDTTVTLQFEGAAQVPQIADGSLLWDRTPTGYVRRVVSTTTSGTTLTALVESASIMDLATDGFWGKRESDDASATMALGLDDCNEGVLPPIYRSESLGIPDIDLHQGSATVGFHDGRLLVGATPNAVEFNFAAGVFVAQMRVETRVCGNFEFGADGVDWNPEYVLTPFALGAHLDFGLFEASVGFMPRLGFSLTASARLNVEAMIGATTFVGVSFVPGQEPTQTFTVVPNNRIGPFIATGEIEAKAYLQAPVELVWGHPQKKCEESQTENNGSLKIGLAIEGGIRASVTQSSQLELCGKVEPYVEATATWIPPLKILDCAEMSAPLKEFPPFYDECIIATGIDAGTDAGVDAGTDSGGTDAGTDASGFDATQDVTVDTGSQDSGPCVPDVTNVDPTSAVAGIPQTFTVTGTCLPLTISFWMADCGGMQTLSVDSTQAVFRCTPMTLGPKAAVIKDVAGGENLLVFGVLVEADADAGGQGTTPNCVELPDTCGPMGNENCCTALTVLGGTFYRSYDGIDFTSYAYPATVSPFALDRFEVTVGRFRAFVDAGMGIQPTAPAAGDGAHPLIAGTGWDPAWNAILRPITAHLKTDVGSCSWSTWTNAAGLNESLPINCVNWYEAFAFCAWDGGRLPTETEWNFAAAGGNEQRYYPWSVPPGSTVIDESYASYGGLGDGVAGSTFADILVPGARPKGDGKWGHADLAGSMWEWTFDWYASPYPQVQCVDCANATESFAKVVRGGSWWDAAYLATAAIRGRIDGPTVRNHHYGIRCARNP